MFSLCYLLLAIFLIFGIYVIIKGDANLHTIYRGCSYICILIMYVVLVSRLLVLFKNSNIAYFFIFLFIIPFIILFLAYKSELEGTFRILDYYLNNEKAFQYGYEDTATIVDIKKIRVGKRGSISKKYYLVVNYNGKKIKSLYFTNSSYSVGESIKIMVYKNRKYIVLDKLIIDSSIVGYILFLNNEMFNNNEEISNVKNLIISLLC